MMIFHQTVCLTDGQEQGPTLQHCDALLRQAMTLMSKHHRL